MSEQSSAHAYSVQIEQTHDRLQKCIIEFKQNIFFIAWRNINYHGNLDIHFYYLTIHLPLILSLLKFISNTPTDHEKSQYYELK